jgi:hypothetical protein
MLGNVLGHMFFLVLELGSCQEHMLHLVQGWEPFPVPMLGTGLEHKFFLGLVLGEDMEHR